MGDRREIYFISTAARLLGLHPQTLRKYERLGLVQPTRTVGSMRVYSPEELERLRLIKHLVDELGINLAGVRRLLSATEAAQRIRRLTYRGRRAGTRGDLAREIDRLCEILGLEGLDDDIV